MADEQIATAAASPTTPTILPDSATPGGGPQPAATAPSTTDTTDTSTPSTLPVTPRKVGQVQPPTPLPPGGFFTRMGHAFAGAILGAMAGKTEVEGYDKNTGKPILKDLHPREQLSKIARNALAGLAAAEATPSSPGMGAEWATGLGAGTMGARAVGQQELKAKQEQFAREQETTMKQMTNAHLYLENMKARKDLFNADLKSNEYLANVGADMLDSAIAGGNEIVGKRDMDSSELAQFRQDHPEYLNYTPLMTKALPLVDAEGKPILDPQTGVQDVSRKWSIVDLNKPIEITQSMIDHLGVVGFPGADKLTAGQKVDPREFQALYWNGLKMYNEANNDPKNIETKDIRDEKGQPRIAAVNKVTGVTHLLSDSKGQPLMGKRNLERVSIADPASEESWIWLVDRDTGEKVMREGLDKSNLTSGNIPLGDYNLSGEDYLKSVPAQYRDVIRAVATYRYAPEALGRSGNRLQILSAAAHYSPGLNEQNYPLRFRYMNNYQGDGPIGQARSRLNMAFSHAALLDHAADALPKNDLIAMNSIANSMGIQSGDSAATVYNLIAAKASAEAAGAMAGTAAPNIPELQKAEAGFRAEFGPKQQHDNIRAQALLMKEQKDWLEEQFLQNMETTPEALGRPVLGVEGQKAYNYLLGVKKIVPSKATHPWKTAADGTTPVFKMEDGSIQDEKGTPYDPKTLTPMVK